MKRRQVWAPSVSMQFVNVSTATHNHMRLASKRLRHGAVNFLPSPLTPPSLSRNYPSAHWSSFPHLLSGDGVGLVQIVRLTRPGRASVLETHVQGSCVRMHFKAEEGGRVHRIDGVCSDDVVQLCLTYERREGATGGGRRGGRGRESQRDANV